MDRKHASACAFKAAHYFAIAASHANKSAEYFQGVEALTEAANTLGYVLIRPASAKEATDLFNPEAAQ